MIIYIIFIQRELAPCQAHCGLTNMIIYP